MWPDGNEKSVGLAISGIRASISAKGLGLATMFFRSRLVTITPKIRDRTAAYPVFRVFGMTRRTTAQRIQNHPPFPRNVTNFINGVSRSILKCFWIWRRISPSRCCIDCKMFICISLLTQHSPLPFLFSDRQSNLFVTVCR